jgi:putative flippase GtrA
MIFRLPLWLRYALFAGIATLVNLGSQAVGLQLYHGPLSLTGAIILGTATGLLTKYLLDKHWIFFDSASGTVANAQKFMLYTTTGIVTTVIFWGAEYGFDALTADGRWRYLGAVIGLAIGYVTKYQLDRRFVFSRAVS